MFSIKDRDVSLADIQSSAILYMAVKDLMFYPTGKPPRLPVAYQEVEYIESSGTQYIDTGYAPNNNTKIYAKFAHNSDTDNGPLFGARGTSSTYNYQYILWTHSSGYAPSGTSGKDLLPCPLFCHEYDTSATTGGIKFLSTRYPKGTVIEFEYDKNGGYYGPDNTWTWNPATNTANINMLIFGLREGTSIDSRKFSGKVYSFKIWESGVLKREFVPCYRKEDNVIGLYDLVTNEFYINSGSGSFARGNNVEYSLPKEYSEVYYIQSTATNPGTVSSSGQYINTDYIPNKDTKITIDMNFDNLTVQSRLFAIHEASNSYMTMAAYINGSSKWARTMKNGEGDWVSTEVAVDTSRHTFTLKNGNYKINTGNTVNYNASNGSTASTSARAPLPLLAGIEPAENNRIVDHSSAKIYGCTIFESEVMVRNLIPCIRKKDKKPGLYDFITKRFFVNAGTGEFTYGAEKLYTQTQNTVAYYPLENDTNDYSGNKKNLTNNGVTFVSEDGIRTGYNNNTVSKYAKGSFALSSGNNPFTVSMFVKNLGKSGWGAFIASGYASGTQALNVCTKDNNFYFGGWTNDTDSGYSKVKEWAHLVFTFDGTTGKLYVDGDLKVSRNVTYSIPTSSVATTLFGSYIGNQSEPATGGPTNGYINQVIFENRAWTIEDINKYRKSIADRYIDKRENYQEVEYIGRNGNNYIDTEWIPDLTLGYKVEVGYKIATSGSRYIIMSSYDGTDNNNGFEINSGSVSNNSLRYLIKGTTFEMFSSNSMSVGSFNDIVFESSGNTKKATLNGTDTTGSYSVSGKFGNSMFLFVDRDLRWTTFSKDSFLSYCSIYDGETLVRDFIPCYRRSDGTVGLWDTVSKKFFSNKGSGAFSKGADVVRERDITFCEYIQSSGTQYIKTNIVPSNTKGIYLKVSSQDVSTDKMYLGSNDNSTDSGAKKFGIGNSSSKLYFGWNGWLPSSSSGNRPPTSANTIVELENNFLNSRLMKKDNNTIYNISETLTSNGYPINIFGHNGGGTAQYFSNIKLYSCKISDGENIIANFKPCYITATGEAGLWDDIEKKFYGNDGTGSFAWDGTPQYREYSYDFRNKSWTTVQNDGWTLLQGTSWTTINSSGIVMPTRGQGASNKIRIYHSENLSNAKKITLQATYNGSTSDWGNSFDFSTRQSSNFDTWGTSIGWGTTTASGYVSRWSASTPNTSVRYGDNPSSGTWTSTAVFDLVNKTITFTRNGLETLTGTISDADIATIKSGNCFAINGGHDTGTLSVQSIYYKIEY